MDKIIFSAFGHKNISSMHKNTFEFTKENFVTKQGDCIVGINSDFEVPKDFLLNSKIKIIIKIEDRIETIFAELNPNFTDEKELVIRKSNFICPRTFAIYADKSAQDFSEDFKEQLKIDNNEIEIEIEKVN